MSSTTADARHPRQNTHYDGTIDVYDTDEDSADFLPNSISKPLDAMMIQAASTRRPREEAAEPTGLG